MKKLFLSIVLTICGTVLMASPVSLQDARTVATNFWLKNLPAGAARTQVEVSEVTGTGFSQFYIFDMNGGKGFVIVSADDCAYPVLGYSMQNPAGELGDNIRFWLGQYEAEIAWLSSQNTAPDAYIKSQWSMLLDGTWDQPKGTHSVSPMLTTKWNQSPYYNAYCPTGTPAGCTAIAMAQVMKYWNHPAIGTGSHSYSMARYGVQSADFGNTTYYWDLMPNSLTSSSSQVQVQATATLCYHVGVSVNMSYGPSGSAAATLGSSNSAQTALPTYFGYKNTLRGIYKINYTDAAWCSALTAELDAGRPILYAGFDPSAGHAFVFHGYNASGQFYVNWGWGGSYDGYFSMGALNPGGGGTGTNGSNTFNQSNQALIGIEPAGALRVSTNMINLTNDTTGTTFVVSSNSHSANRWTATTTANWLTLTPSNGNGNGALTTVTLTPTLNSTGIDRHATIQLVQDTDTVVVHVSQTSCAAANMCTLTVNMTDSRSDGWDGAYLTFSSTSGTVYGSATVGGGNYSVESIRVCPDTVVVDWHAGRYDGECAFSILNASGVAWINHAQGTSISDGRLMLIPMPCSDTGGVTPPVYSVTGVSSDTLAGSVTGSGTNLTFASTRRLAAIANTGYRFLKWNDNNTDNPRDVTVTGNTTYTALYTNLGEDTLHYDDGDYSTALGISNTNNFMWGIRFAASDLEGRPNLEGVQFFNLKAGTYTVTIATGSAIKPATTDAARLYSGSVTLSSQYTNRWITLNFDTPVALNLPSNKYLWITLKVPGVTYPAAISRWSGNESGSLYSSNAGSSWKNIATDGNYGSWMLRAIAPIDHNEYTITARPNRGTWGSVTGGGVYPYGTRITLTATPKEGYHFEKWDNDVTQNPYTFMVTGDLLIRAMFAENTPDPPQGIDDAEAGSTVAVAVNGRSLTLIGAEGRAVSVYDALGRCVYRSDAFDNSTVQLSATGVYLVRVDGSASMRVLVY